MAWVYAMAKQISDKNSGRSSGARVAAERPRGGRARRMGEMLPEVGGVAFRRFGFVQSAIVSRWTEIVGDRYGKASTPESIRFPHGKRDGGTLSIMVTSAHAPMMQHVLPVIMEKVNRFFGYAAVAKIDLRHGVIPLPRRKLERPAPAPIPVELGDSLKTVADPELRAVLESLAQSVAAQSVSIEIRGKIR
jgi:hypothetical protein